MCQRQQGHIADFKTQRQPSSMAHLAYHSAQKGGEFEVCQLGEPCTEVDLYKTTQTNLPWLKVGTPKPSNSTIYTPNIKCSGVNLFSLASSQAKY